MIYPNLNRELIHNGEQPTDPSIEVPERIKKFFYSAIVCWLLLPLIVFMLILVPLFVLASPSMLTFKTEDHDN